MECTQLNLTKLLKALVLRGTVRWKAYVSTYSSNRMNLIWNKTYFKERLKRNIYVLFQTNYNPMGTGFKIKFHVS